MQHHVTQYLQQHPELTQRVLGSCQAADWRLTELTEGRINFMFRVDGPSGSACLKCYQPYAKAAGESFLLSLERMAVEAAAMRQLHGICPAHVPQVLHHDPSASVLLLQYLPPPHQKLLSGLAAGQHYPEAPVQLGQLLASYLWSTSVYCLAPEQYSAAVQQYANEDVRATNENVVLRWPFQPHPSNRCTPGLEAQVARLRTDPGVQEAVLKLQHAYSTQREALIHNDLHTGNLLVTPPPASSLALIDWEFATYGPLAFDLGSLVANLLLSAFALPVDAAGPDAGPSAPSQRQRRWILEAVTSFWLEFEAASAAHMPAAGAGSRVGTSTQAPGPLAPAHTQSSTGARPPGSSIGTLGTRGSASIGPADHGGGQCECCTSATSAPTAAGWRVPHEWAAATATATTAATCATAASSSEGVPTCPPQQQQQQQRQQQPPGMRAPSLQAVQQDAAGFAGVCMLRLIGGMHHYPMMDTLPEEGGVRARHEGAALQCALELLLQPQLVMGAGGWAGVAARHLVDAGLELDDVGMK